MDNFLQLFLEDLRGQLFHGQQPDKYRLRKDKKREKTAREQQERVTGTNGFRGERADAAQRRRAKLDFVSIDAVALGPCVACLHLLRYCAAHCTALLALDCTALHCTLHTVHRRAGAAKQWTVLAVSVATAVFS